MAIGGDFARLGILIEELDKNVEADLTMRDANHQERQFCKAELDAAIEKLDQLRQKLQVD